MKIGGEETDRKRCAMSARQFAVEFGLLKMGDTRVAGGRGFWWSLVSKALDGRPSWAFVAWTSCPVPGQ